MSKTDKMLLRMIKNSKGQFAAVVTIIVAGITVFISLNMSAVNMENTVNDYYEITNFADLYVVAENIPAQRVIDIENTPGVASVQGRIVMDASFITGNEAERVNVRLISSRGEDDLMNMCYLLEGRWLKPGSRETMVLGQFGNARGIAPDDKIEVRISGARYALDVASVVANPEFVYLMENEQAIMTNPEKFGVLYISEALARQMSGISGANEILITYSEGANEENIIRSLENQLGNYGLRQIIKREDQISNVIVQMEVESLQTMSSAVPVVFLAAAGLVLIMMLSRMVKRDRIKIGILKALGYQNREIIAHYTKYAAITGFTGGLIGSVLGMISAGGLTSIFLEYFNIPILSTGFYPLVVVVSIVATCVFCVISGVIGSRGILKISPADSMKSESPKAGKHILVEQIPAIWRRFSFSQKLITKNIFRNKKRAAFIISGVALTYAMLLFTTSMPETVDDMLNAHYREFQKMDYIIGLRTPVKESSVNDIRHMIDVEYMEGKLEYPFEFQNGNRKQIVSVIGLKSDTQFYTFRNAAGELVDLPKSGVLITETLAKNLRLNVGDTVRLGTFIPGRNDVYVEVREIIRQTLGMNAYMDIAFMGERFLEKNTVNGIYLNSSDDKIYEELLRASHIASVISIEDVKSMFEEYMAIMNVSLTFMVLFSGILGFCIVYNATSIIIGEREMEFSALRVLGLSQKEIFKMILNENNLLMLAGIACGIPLGMLMSSALEEMVTTDMFSFNMAPTGSAMIYAALLTTLFVFFAQFAAYQKIKKLDLLGALKNRMN